MPLQQVYPGVEVHANMLNALLNSVSVVDVQAGQTDTQSVFSVFSRNDEVSFPYKPDWEGGGLFVLILVLGLSLSMLFPYLGAASMAATSLTLVVAAVWFNFQQAKELPYPLQHQ